MKRIKRVNEVFLMTVAIAVVSSFLIGIISGIFGANEMVTLIISQLIFFMPSAFYLLENRFDLKETIRLHRIKVSTVVLLVVFMYLLMPAITFINAVSLKFTTNTIDTTVMEIANQYPFIIGILMTLGATVLGFMFVHWTIGTYFACVTISFIYFLFLFRKIYNKEKQRKNKKV